MNYPDLYTNIVNWQTLLKGMVCTVKLNLHVNKVYTYNGQSQQLSVPQGKAVHLCALPPVWVNALPQSKPLGKKGLTVKLGQL